MTLEAFEQLDYAGKLKATHKAVCIGSRSDAIYTILLYQIDGFYIEVHYHNKFDYVSSFTGFETTDRLDPYLAQVDIEMLVH